MCVYRLTDILESLSLSHIYSILCPPPILPKRFGAVRNQTLMFLVLGLGLFFVIIKVGYSPSPTPINSYFLNSPYFMDHIQAALVVTCTSIDSDWCFNKKEVSLVAEGDTNCFH